MRIGLLHPGEMGAAVGAALRDAGHAVAWASEGRSPATAARAAEAGLEDLATVAAVAEASDVLLSVCPPHAALELARSVGAFRGLYLDANAVSPETSRRVGRLLVDGGARYVDGGIIGPPPVSPGSTRLYLSGPDAVAAGELFATPLVETHIVSEWPGAASAVKLSYAAWTKGTSALLLAIRAAARAEGVEDWLLDEWSTSQPELTERSLGAARSGLAKGWRWDGEMLEVAAMFADSDLPDGFHRAAAEVFSRLRRPEGMPADPLGAALDQLNGRDRPVDPG